MRAGIGFGIYYLKVMLLKVKRVQMLINNPLIATITIFSFALFCTWFMVSTIELINNWLLSLIIGLTPIYIFFYCLLKYGEYFL